MCYSPLWVGVTGNFLMNYVQFTIAFSSSLSHHSGNCNGTWSTGCNTDGTNCLYKAWWMVLGDVQKVFFTVEARTTGWVGIGFSNNQIMVCSVCTLQVSIVHFLQQKIYGSQQHIILLSLLFCRLIVMLLLVHQMIQVSLLLTGMCNQICYLLVDL